MPHAAWAPRFLFFACLRRPQLDQDSPPNIPPPFSSPHLLTHPRVPTHTPNVPHPSPTQPNDTTHRCCPLPASRCPLPAQGAHSHPFDRPRLRIFLPHLSINPAAQLHLCGAQQGRRARLHICTTSATASAPAAPAPSGPSAALAQQASGSTVTRTTLALFAYSFARR